MPDAGTMTTIERRQQRICRHPTLNRMAQACSSLLVPLMIAIFTIVITMLQMSLAKQQREQDLQIAKDNREKYFEIANQTRILQDQIEDKRRAAEVQAQEDHQMNNVLAAYLKNMAELMLSPKFTLTVNVIATVVRAKNTNDTWTIGWETQGSSRPISL